MKYFLLNKPRGCVTSRVDAGFDRPTVYEIAKAAGREHSGSVGCHAKRGSLDFRQIWLVERYLCTLKDRHRCAVDVRPPYFVLEGVPDFGAVGRLDLDTSGVLIFTDDGRLKRAISSPHYKGKAKSGTVPSMEKVYHALVAGTVRPDEKRVQLMREPLHFTRKMDGPEGFWTKPAEVRVIKTKNFAKGQPVPWRFKPGTTATITWIEVILREGKNRQIRRLCQRSDFELIRLHRVSVGPIFLGDLQEGCCRELTRREVEALYKRCLPEDPLRPTVRQVRETLTVCFERAVRRQLTQARPVPHSISRRCSESSQGNEKGEQGGVSAIQTRPDIPIRSGAVGGRQLPTEAADDRRHPGTQAFVGEMTKVEASGIILTEGLVGNVLSYSLGDLHEAPEGPNGECGLPELCPGEGDSLRHAQAIPPNEAHMVCGYRKSQIERLPQ